MKRMVRVTGWMMSRSHALFSFLFGILVKASLAVHERRKNMRGQLSEGERGWS
jgi:hypothetical protein